MIISNNIKDETTKKRILFVDDEETLRLSIKQVLSEDGYEVITAKNGTEALELAHAEGFDLVITDLRMPGLSGLQLVSEIKKTDPLTKVIVISAYGSMETVIEAMRLGVNDFVAKPFKVKSMKEIVTKILNVSKKKPRTENLYKVTTNAGEAERGTKSPLGGLDASDCILIQPNVSYYLEQSQEASLGSSAFFDVVDVAEKRFALIFGSIPSNVGARCNVPLLGTMVKTTFRTVIAPFMMPNESDNHIHPQYVVEKINKYLCLNTKPRVPVSLFCATVDKKKGVIEYVNHGQKLFCYLLQGDAKIATLESSPYPLNLFPDIYIEEKTSLPASGKLILLSSDSLTTMPVSKEAGQSFAKDWVGCTGKETARKIRTSLSSALPVDNLDNDWVVAVVDLNWNGIEPKQEKIIIPASTEDFRGIVSKLENLLKGFALTPQKEHAIITAINEAIINARLFAYSNGSHHGGDVKTGDIIVTFKVMGNELIVEVFDSGCGFSVQSYKKPDFTNYQPFTGESGRGIFLIQELMDRVMIQSSETVGTRVYMAKEILSNGS
ncbi:MAG: response regulator [Planctomycetes bacterium]|nr:response regulator [Planctomycetota bacterium]